MNEILNKKQESKKTLKIFFIKLLAISIASVIVINLVFNLLFAERVGVGGGIAKQSESYCDCRYHFLNFPSLRSHFISSDLGREIPTGATLNSTVYQICFFD